MAHPLLDFDAIKATDAVLEDAAYPPCVKAKAVIYVSRGMGGGKTRVMETMRRLMLRRDGVLPLAITFNGDSSLIWDSWLPKDGKQSGMDVVSSYGLSVAARMVSGVLGMDYLAVAKRIKANLAHLDVPKTDGTSAIRDTVLFLVDPVNSARAQQVPPPPVVRTVVLLLDESLKMDEFVDSRDLAFFAQAALLNKPIAPGLSAALVVSDLGFVVAERWMKKSSPYRAAHVLHLPARLSPARVVIEWWGRDVPSRVLTAESRLVLELAAALLNNMPRALEFADTFLRSDKNLGRPVDKALLRDMYEHVFTTANGRYQPNEPSADILAAMIYGEPVPLNDKLVAALSRSVVTNPITCFSNAIKPDASLVLLGVLSRKPRASHIVKFIGGSIDCIIETFTPATSSETRSPSDVVQEAGLQALRCRLALARKMEGLTLARLCGVVAEGESLDYQHAYFTRYANPATAAFLSVPLDLEGWEYDGVVDRLGACSQGSKKNEAAFLAELDALEVSVSRPVRLVRPMEGESWDLCVKAQDPATGEAFCIFFNDKSSAEFSEAKGGRVLVAPQQYLHTKAVLGPARPFLYISTYMDAPSQVLPAANAAEDALPSRCLALGREDTLSLLGPFAEIYKVARAAVGGGSPVNDEAKNQL